MFLVQMVSKLSDDNRLMSVEQFNCLLRTLCRHTLGFVIYEVQGDEIIKLNANMNLIEIWEEI